MPAYATATRRGPQATARTRTALIEQPASTADLVVIPMPRAKELAHLLHDRYVLHRSDVPVLVVPTDGHDAGTSSA